MSNGYSDKKKVERDQDQRNISPFAKGSALQTGVLNQDYGGMLKITDKCHFCESTLSEAQKWNKSANLYFSRLVCRHYHVQWIQSTVRWKARCH